MKTLTTRSILLVVLTMFMSFMSGAGVGAQPEAAEPQPASPAEAPPRLERRMYATNSVVRIGQSYTLAAGDTTREVVVILGDAIIAGEVESDVVVILGHVTLESTAVVGGDFVSIAGSATVEPGATVKRDVTVVGGTMDAPAGFSPGGEHVVIGSPAVGVGLEHVMPWVTRGLLWGRLLVPSLPGTWVILAFGLAIYAGLVLVFNRPIRVVTDTLAERPIGSFLTGLLVLLLVGPACFLLAVSLVGIVVIPFVLCALLAAVVAGKVAVTRWIGRRAVGEETPDSGLQALRSVAIGFILLSLAFMVPVVGLAAWATASGLALGAASLTVVAAMRRENPRPARPVTAPPPVPPTPDTSLGGAPEIPLRQSEPAQVFAEGPAPPRFAGQSLVHDLTLLPRAAFLERLAAAALDVVVVLLVNALLNFDRGPGRTLGLLFLTYHVVFWAWKGTTVGGMICRLHVVRVDGAPLAFGDAFIRGLTAILSIAVFGLGFLWILKTPNPDRQAWHDLVAGTVVVKVPAPLPRGT